MMDEGRDCSLRACRASSMRTAMRAMERVMAAPFFCGASAARICPPPAAQAGLERRSATLASARTLT